MEQDSRNRAVASFICGVLSFVLAWGGYTGSLSVVLGIIGIVVGVQANRIKKDQLASWGIVLSVLGIFFGAIVFILCMLFAAGLIGAAFALAN